MSGGARKFTRRIQLESMLGRSRKNRKEGESCICPKCSMRFVGEGAEQRYRKHWKENHSTGGGY